MAEHGFTRFLAAKRQIDPAPQDPIKELRDGWDAVVEFGRTNPALYLLMYGEPTRSTAVIRIGLEHLLDRIRRIAAAGLLRVEEGLAVQIVHAAAGGAILTWLSVPEPQRNPELLVALRESMVTTVTTREPAVREQGPAGAARALRAALPGQNALSEAEQQLLAEWLRRLSA
ncbi:TetR family transcriptional regulator [Embleya sp. NPDC059259]|uniref:TetR family transcriptional regulator n=1 Tax=unclassified Embleya TaxID=2699296 RepID=UPI00367FD33C